MRKWRVMMTLKPTSLLDLVAMDQLKIEGLQSAIKQAIEDNLIGIEVERCEAVEVTK
jgi:hypothetical protein